MKNHLRSLVAALAAAVSFTGFGGTTYYVSPTGDGTAPTAGFATGYSSIQDAIDAASAGDTVMLDKTTFSVKTEIQVNKAITLCGIGENWETVLDGENANNNILKISVAGATVHSLTYIRCGIKWANKIGLEMTANSMVSNVVARGNGNDMADNTQGRYVMNVSAGFVTHCCITNNNAPNNAGIKLSGSSKMENCYIADNVDRGYSGTMFYGIVVVEGTAMVRNCTIVNNKSNYSALYYSTQNGVVGNNIIWGNVAHSNDQTTANWRKSNANWSTAKWTKNCTSPVEGLPVGNFDDNPQLESDNMHIPSTSPCYGTADTSTVGVPATDIEGNPRGEFPCVGCCEYVSKSFVTCEIEASAERSVLPQTIVLTAKVGGSPVGDVTYAWDFNGDGKVDSTDAQVELTRQGRYEITLQVMDEVGTPARTQYPNKIFIYDAGAEGLKFYASPTGDGTDPTKGFATGFPTLKLAFADADLVEGSMLILDRARFDLSIANQANEIHDVNGVTITKRIVVTGVGKREETILDGGEEHAKRRFGERHHLGFVFSADGIVFRNMTFERMGSDAGAAIQVSNGISDCVISNMCFRNTGAYPEWGDYPAGSLLTGDKNTIVSHCVFTNNVFPAAVLSMTGNANARLENCYFADNTCTGAKKDNGVVLLNFGGFPALGKCLNCTIRGNRSKGAAFRHDGYGNAGVVNCIVASNVNLDGAAANYSGNGYREYWSHCCIGEGPDVEKFTDPTNIFADPKFVSETDGHIQKDSPCVNAGDNGSYTADSTDLDGLPRIVRRMVDIGCYENQAIPGLQILVR